MVRLVKSYNMEHEDSKMKYAVGKSESKMDNVYTIRALLQKAMTGKEEQEV